MSHIITVHAAPLSFFDLSALPSRFRTGGNSFELSSAPPSISTTLPPAHLIRNQYLSVLHLSCQHPAVFHGPHVVSIPGVVGHFLGQRFLSWRSFAVFFRGGSGAAHPPAPYPHSTFDLPSPYPHRASASHPAHIPRTSPKGLLRKLPSHPKSFAHRSRFPHFFPLSVFAPHFAHFLLHQYQHKP
jgi:hypothetical protein